MQQLGIVRKTVAVCNNLNCSYCYCFNGIGDAFKRHPRYIASDTIERIPRFLKQSIRFSFIKSTLALFFGGTSISYGISPGNKAQILLVTVATHGHLSPVNEWRATDLGMMHTANVATPSLKNFLAIPLCQEIAERQQNSRAPCCWENSCGGGGTLHRFSHKSTLPRPPSTVRDVCMGIKQRPGGRYAQKK